MTRQVADIERGEANSTSEKICRAFGFQIGFVPISAPGSEPTSMENEPTAGPRMG